MADKKIFLLTKDQHLEKQVKESLSSYTLIFFTSFSNLMEAISRENYVLGMIDHDIDNYKGLDYFRVLKRKNEKLKVLMFSALNDIPLAVKAVKQGVFELLLKPLDEENFQKTFISFFEQSERSRCLNIPEEGFEWLLGNSAKKHALLNDVLKVLEGDLDVVVSGAEGVLFSLAYLLHANSSYSHRQMIVLDLLAYEKKMSEGQFWILLKELLVGNTDKEKACGTLFIKNTAKISEYFRLSLFNFLEERAKDKDNFEGRFDQNIRIIMDWNKSEGSHPLAGFYFILVPSLKDRKEDLPFYLEALIKKYAALYNKEAPFIQPGIISLFMLYDFPFNYEELDILVRNAVLNAGDQGIRMQDIPMNAASIVHKTLLEYKFINQPALAQGIALMEKNYIQRLLAQNDFNLSSAARLLDIPISVLQERIEKHQIA